MCSIFGSELVDCFLSLCAHQLGIQCVCVCVLSFTVRHKRLHSPSEIDMCEIKRRVNFIGFYIEMCYAFAFSFHVFQIDRVRFTMNMLGFGISGCRAIIFGLFDFGLV